MTYQVFLKNGTKRCKTFFDAFKLLVHYYGWAYADKNAKNHKKKNKKFKK